MQRKAGPAKSAGAPPRHGTHAAVAARPAQQRRAALAKPPARIAAQPAAAQKRTHRRRGPVHVARTGERIPPGKTYEGAS